MLRAGNPLSGNPHAPRQSKLLIRITVRHVFEVFGNLRQNPGVSGFALVLFMHNFSIPIFWYHINFFIIFLALGLLHGLTRKSTLGTAATAAATAKDTLLKKTMNDIFLYQSKIEKNFQEIYCGKL
jgi:hypothetical protein